MAGFKGKGTIIMNAMTVTEQTPVYDHYGLRMVHITSLRNMSDGRQYFVELHDERGTVRRVVSVNFNSPKPVKAWIGNEGVTIGAEGRGAIHFVCHTMKGPKFPVAKIIGPRGEPRNVRVTFYTTIDEDTEAEQKPLTLADFPKPNRDDYENQGAYLAACKVRKAAMREAGLKD